MESLKTVINSFQFAMITAAPKLVLPLCIVICSLLAISEASNKKGVGVTFSHEYHCTDEYKFNNVHWWYTWKQRPDNMHRAHHCKLQVKPGFVPMINGHQWNRGINISAESKYVLGFNEPDHFDQSNLTVDQAVTMWREVEKHAVGKVLVSPAVTDITWLERFFHKCHNCRVDHVAIHVYDHNCNAHHIMSVIKRAWDRFHKPIWLTEFACPFSHSANDQLRFMRAILPLLEASPHVFRYAWFVSRWLVANSNVHSDTSLLQPYTAEMTTLGHYYNNYV